MGDSMKKVRSGDPLNIPAATFNTFIDSAQDFLARQNNSNRQSGKDMRSSGIILVKNTSGGDRERFHVLGIKEPVISASDNEDQFKNRVALKGETPTEDDHTGRFVILLEPLRSNAIGLAMASGVCPVRLQVADETSLCADIYPGNPAFLKALPSGGAQILWKESGTGERWGIVRFPFATGGGGGEIKLVQVMSVNSSDRTVSTKSVILKSDLTQTPNFTVNDSESAVTYPYLVRS